MTGDERSTECRRPAAASHTPAIDARGVSKRFGGIQALRDVSLRVDAGTVHALVGENGAGKSTFLGTIAGRLAPSAGEVAIFGAQYEFGSPRYARKLGISAIYQELTIVPGLSTQANVFLGQTLTRLGMLSEAGMRGLFEALCERFGVRIPADVPAGGLSIADQQMVEIMRGIQSDARLLLFDEPTTALAVREREALFRVMSQLRDGGVTMVLVSHNLDEVLAIADVVTVFRDGELAATAPRERWTKRELVRAMIGHDVREGARVRGPARPRQEGPPLLRAENITVPGALDGVSLEVRAGEVLGVGGLVGSGRSTLLRALAGLEPGSRGALSLEGVAQSWPKTPRQAIRAGISLVPEDRKRQGLVLGMTVRDNIAMSDFGRVSRHGFLSSRALDQAARATAGEFGLDEARLGATVRHLSGGNQQKVLLGRWHYRRPRILLADEPTRGIDIGAKEEVLATLRHLADQGVGIVLVSSELEEVTALADRVLVLSEGRAVGELDAADGPLTVERILNAAFRVEAA